jgi:hypothetical protein
MKFKTKRIVVTGCVVVLLGAIYLCYGYLYKDARDISSEKTAHTVTASQLVADYTADPKLADGKYLNAALEVKGKVTEVTDSVLTLDSIIFCGFNHIADENLLHKQVTVKGRCIGYDELFNEVKLDECSITE